MTSEQILASKTIDQLKAGIAKGREKLNLIDALEASEDMMTDGPFRASKQYENWSAGDYANRRRQYWLAINLSIQEIARRQEGGRHGEK